MSYRNLRLARFLRLLLPLGLAAASLWILLSTLAPAQAATPLAPQVAPGRTARHLSRAQAAPTDALNVDWVSQLGGASAAVALRGQYAYLGLGPRLVILNLAQPATPTVVGQTAPFSYPVRGLAVAGNYAYVVLQSGLWVVNIATPTAPVALGFWPHGGSVLEAVAVVGNYAYLAAGTGGLRVVQVATPTSPVLVGSVSLPNVANDVAVAGNYAYVAGGVGGLRVVNIATPTAPVAVGFVDTPGDAQGVALVGNYAYVADANSGLRVVNITTPTAPVSVGFYDTPVSAVDVWVLGSYAYVADDQSGLRVVSVATPTAPAEVGFVDTPGFAWGVAVTGTYAYVADVGRGLRAVNIANPAGPVLRGAYDPMGRALNSVVRGGYAYVVDNTGLRVVQITNPAAPALVGFLALPSQPADVVLVGNYAYVAAGWSGLRVVNIATPTAPVEVGFYNTPGTAAGVAVAGNYAYVADGSSGLRVINIATPTAPVEVGFYDTPGTAGGVAVVGNYAYVADGGGLRVVYIASPTAPTEFGFYDTPGTAYDVVVAGNYGYVADFTSGLRVVNIATPTAPVEVGFYNTPGLALGVALRGRYAYIADISSLQVVDIATPTAPVDVGFADTAGSATGVAAVEGYVYMSDDEGGFTIFQHGALPQCFTEYTGDTVTDFNSPDAQAVRDAVAAAPTGGTVKIAGYCAGVQTQSATTQTVLINKILTLTGGYSTTNWTTYNPTANPTTLDAQGGGRVVRATTAATLQGLTVTHGYLSNTLTGAGIHAANAITLNQVVVYNNVITGPAGAFRNGGGAVFTGRATISASQFISNSAGGNGGGALFNNAATITGTLFLRNHAQPSSIRSVLGGGASFEGPSDAAVWITNTSFISNTAQNGGGLSAVSPLTLTQVLFQGNRATTTNAGVSTGGGARLYQTAVLTRVTFLNNTALDRGGGLVTDITTTVANSVFRNNATRLGGGLYAGGGATYVTNTLFAGNTAITTGAALYINGSALQLVHATVTSPTLGNTPALYVAAGSAALTNTLLASYTVGLHRANGTVREDYNLFANVATPYSGTVLSGGHSLTGTAGFYNTTNYTLTAASRAVEVGTPAEVVSDYFGNPRPWGRAPDLGYAEAAYSFSSTLALVAQPAHLFANGLETTVLTVTAQLTNGTPLPGQVVTLTAPQGTLANAVVTLNANGVATTTYTVGVIPGPTLLTATVNDLGVPTVATTTLTLKPNPLSGRFQAVFAGQTFTYTFVVTNVDTLTQTVNLSGSVPPGGNIIAVTGGISVATGGDYGSGYVAANNLILAPNASHTLTWTIELPGVSGEVFNLAHAESATARLRLPAWLRVYRQLLMPVFGPPAPAFTSQP